MLIYANQMNVHPSTLCQKLEQSQPDPAIESSIIPAWKESGSLPWERCLTSVIYQNNTLGMHSNSC